MKTIILSLMLLPTISWASIYSLNSDTKLDHKLKTMKQMQKQLFLEKHIDYDGFYAFPENWNNYIKRPRHTILSEELRTQYQNNYNVLKKCYIKPQDNLQDIVTVMGQFINAYGDIVYGKNIISYQHKLQEYNFIINKIPLNKGVNPEECMKAKDFFDNELI